MDYSCIRIDVIGYLTKSPHLYYFQKFSLLSVTFLENLSLGHNDQFNNVIFTSATLCQ